MGSVGFGLLGYDAVQSYSLFPMLWKNLSPPSSWYLYPKDEAHNIVSHL